VIAGSGGGKSFLTNHMVRSYYEQGTHVLIFTKSISFLNAALLCFSFNMLLSFGAPHIDENAVNITVMIYRSTFFMVYLIPEI